MRENLRPKAGKGRKFADRDGVRAIDQVPMGYGGMFAENELWLAIGFLREMAGWTRRKSGNPIAVSNRCVGFEMQKRNVFAESEIPDRRVFFHDQSLRKDPGESDPAGRVNGVAELFFEKAPPHFPGKQHADEHEERFHTWAPSSR